MQAVSILLKRKFDHKHDLHVVAKEEAYKCAEGTKNKTQRQRTWNSETDAAFLITITENYK